MKKDKNIQQPNTDTPNNSQYPDFDIIDLEKDDNIGAARPAKSTQPQSKPTQAAPVSKAPVQSSPTPKTAVQSIQVRKVPSQSTPVQKAPVQSVPSQKNASQNTPVQKTPVQSVPSQKNASQNTPVQEVSTENTSVPNASSQDDPVWNEPQDAIDVREEDLIAHKKKKPSRASIIQTLRPYLNTHVLLLAVLIIFIVCIFVKFKNWGEHIDLAEIEHDNSEGYLDVLDQILPLTDSSGKPVSTGKVDTILAFGNAPFADDRDSKDNLANLIATATGATVYNCSVSGSYLAAQHPFFSADVAPMDVYSFYWLVTLATSGANAHNFTEAVTALGEDAPPEAQEVFDTLTTIDMNKVDVITIMYDASDYLMGHEMYDDANATNIQQFTGNLEAGIELLQADYPNIRIIVMSPTYAYALNENGEYVSSDMQRYGQDVLSTYVIKEYASCASRSVSFIDHLYGTITEANASEYLIDNLHLNTNGRKLVANRFVKVLNYYNR